MMPDPVCPNASLVPVGAANWMAPVLVSTTPQLRLRLASLSLDDGFSRVSLLPRLTFEPPPAAPNFLPAPQAPASASQPAEPIAEPAAPLRAPHPQSLLINPGDPMLNPQVAAMIPPRTVDVGKLSFGPFRGDVTGVTFGLMLGGTLGSPSGVKFTLGMFGNLPALGSGYVGWSL